MAPVPDGAGAIEPWHRRVGTRYLSAPDLWKPAPTPGGNSPGTVDGAGA